MEVGTLCEKELRGATKKKSLPQMLKRAAAQSGSRTYVNFGEPMPLMTYLNQHVPEVARIYRPYIEAIRPAADADGKMVSPPI